MSFIFGGGDPAPTQTGDSQVIQREAPGVEARKLSLYDQAAKLAAQPVSLPGIQVAPISAIEQQAIQQAGQTGVGAPTVQAGIGALQAGMQAPNISQFFNPYQSYVTDEITRQAQMAQNRLGAQQQAMSLADIQSQLQAGALQRGIGQQALEAQRQTELQRAYEPYQRIEFLKGIMTNLPTTQSTVTATTAPGANPLGQALGAGLGAYSTYNLMQNR